VFNPARAVSRLQRWCELRVLIAALFDSRGPDLRLPEAPSDRGPVALGGTGPPDESGPRSQVRTDPGSTERRRREVSCDGGGICDRRCGAVLWSVWLRHQQSGTSGAGTPRESGPPGRPELNTSRGGAKRRTRSHRFARRRSVAQRWQSGGGNDERGYRGTAPDYC
jgi:hypothetical protein